MAWRHEDGQAAGKVVLDAVGLATELYPDGELLVVFVELIIRVGDRIERVACEAPAPGRPSG
jgi:hypothetical protein